MSNAVLGLTDRRQPLAGAAAPNQLLPESTSICIDQRSVLRQAGGEPGFDDREGISSRGQRLQRKRQGSQTGARRGAVVVEKMARSRVNGSGSGNQFPALAGSQIQNF